MKESQMLIIAITGMPGAGKSTAASALTRIGMLKVVMGDVVREETKARGLIPDEKGTGRVMRDLRRKMGKGAIAQLSLRAIRSSGEKRIVVDGVRSMAEVRVFEKIGKVLLLAIHASRQRRYKLLKRRGRLDDPLSWKTFLKRDRRELDVGIGTAIALADEVVSNERASPDSLRKKVLEVLNGWINSVE